MDYEKLAEQMKNKIVEHIDGSEITITAKEAMDYYLCCVALSRIKKISESEYGGSELFN